ncbi:MAG: hypothetical protein QGH45_22495 [Myxococcota bacterium]|jgi:hypothetical protein|nr:hypothetical protein [Myxococcota bacterium]
MTRWAAVAAAVVLCLGGLAGVSCSTRSLCGRACDVWSDCGMWDYDVCELECVVEGNWAISTRFVFR